MFFGFCALRCFRRKFDFLGSLTFPLNAFTYKWNVFQLQYLTPAIAQKNSRLFYAGLVSKVGMAVHTNEADFPKAKKDSKCGENNGGKAAPCSL